MDKFRRIFLTLLSLLMIFTSVLPVAAEDTTDINMFNEDSNVVITESEAIIEDNNFQEIEEVPVVVQEGEEGTNLTAMYILSGVALVLFAILAIILKKKNN